MSVGSLIFQGAQVENLEETSKTLALRCRLTARDYAKRVGVPTSRLDESKTFFRHVAADERNSAVLKRISP